jgi:hypothetical protein
MALRLTNSLCIGFGFCFLVLVYFYFRPLLLLAETKNKLRKSPGAWVVPRPLANESTNRPDLPKVSYFGYEFVSPVGFLEGDIARDNSVEIEAYDRQDRQIMIWLGRLPGKACFCQAQLDQIIFSLKPVSE